MEKHNQYISRQNISPLEEQSLKEATESYLKIIATGADNEGSIDYIIKILRQALKIDEMTNLRYEIIHKATSNM